MISSASLSTIVAAINRDPQHLTTFQDPFTHKPLDTPPLSGVSESNAASGGKGAAAAHTIDIVV